VVIRCCKAARQGIERERRGAPKALKEKEEDIGERLRKKRSE
jgi:hypothetical protein